jgi:TonB family protein
MRLQYGDNLTGMIFPHAPINKPKSTIMKTLTINKVVMLLLSGMALTFVSCDKKADDTTEETSMTTEPTAEAFDIEAYESAHLKYSSELDEINAKHPDVYYVYYSDPNGWYTTNHGTYSARVYGLDKDAELSKQYNEILRNRYNERARRMSYYSTVYTSTAMPKDGYDKFYQALGNKLSYPEGTETEGVEGTVMVGFTVDATGAVKNVHVIDGLLTSKPEVRDQFYKEATDAIQSTSGTWTPAQQAGTSVETDLEIPITFELKS